MTFEPWRDDDEYETAATRPRPRRLGRRAVRRRYAILGVLAEEGPCGVSVLERRLRRAPGTLYPDLAALEHGLRIKVLHADREPGHTAYRLATTAERWDPERR